MAKTVETVTVSPPPEISRNRGPFLYYVVDLGNGNVRLSPDPGGTYGPAMPRSSVKHFVNDMSGRVELKGQN